MQGRLPAQQSVCCAVVAGGARSDSRARRVVCFAAPQDRAAANRRGWAHRWATESLMSRNSRNFNGYRVSPGGPRANDVRMWDRGGPGARGEEVATAYTAPGVYAVVCTATGNAYVGSSIDAKKRLDDHRSALRNQKHPNRALLREWNLYGELTFEFRFIERVADVKSLREREQFWIDSIGTLNKRAA